jgi:hypothetical protein
MKTAMPTTTISMDANSRGLPGPAADIVGFICGAVAPQARLPGTVPTA